MSRPATKLAADITVRRTRSAQHSRTPESVLTSETRRKSLRLVSPQRNSPHAVVVYSPVVRSAKGLRAKNNLEAVASFRQFVASSSPRSDITALLVDWSNGNRAALDVLIPLVEKELRRLAHSYMRREDPDHTLQTTA